MAERISRARSARKLMKKDTVLGLHAAVAIDDERFDELIILAVVV